VGYFVPKSGLSLTFFCAMPFALHEVNGGWIYGFNCNTAVNEEGSGNQAGLSSRVYRWTYSHALYGTCLA